jgi:hypothetical protein
MTSAQSQALLEYACHCSGVPAWKVHLQTVDLSIPEDTAKSMKYFERYVAAMLLVISYFRFLAFHPYHHIALYRLGYLYKNVSKDYAKAKKVLAQSFQRYPGMLSVLLIGSVLIVRFPRSRTGPCSHIPR